MARLNTSGLILSLAAVAAFIPCLIAYPIASMLSALSGALLATALMRRYALRDVLKYCILAWTLLAIVSALTLSDDLAVFSAGLLITSALTASSMSSRLDAVEASLTFLLPYFTASTLLMTFSLGIPPSKYLPLMFWAGLSIWVTQPLVVRLVFAASSSYYITAYLIKDVRWGRIPIAVIFTAFIYTAVSIMEISASSVNEAPYIAGLALLVPLLIYVWIVRIGRL